MNPTEEYRQAIKATLEARYFPLIPADGRSRDADQERLNRLSRSLAALAIEKLAKIEPEEAANAVMDGGNDNGIDAVCFDRANKRLWLIQSKLHRAPDFSEALKFCSGTRDLLNWKFEKFNAQFERMQQDVEDALDTAGLLVVACTVHLDQRLETHARGALDTLKTECNEYEQRLEWQDLNLNSVHGWLLAEHQVVSLDITLEIENWAGVKLPHKAYYGTVTAKQLAELYRVHDKALFQRNIRHYLGAQTVNSAIANTVEHNPSLLLYLNNGITAVCSTVNPRPGARGAQGRFDINGFSIVNGAQTVGSIAETESRAGDILPDAKLLITIVEVGDHSSGFASEITRARNTQNAIVSRDFAALDRNQERIRQELALEGITYYYRASQASSLATDDEFTFQEAALALACFKGDTNYVVAAKREVGQIYNPAGTYYPEIFKDDLPGRRLYRLVRIYRYLSSVLINAANGESSGKRKTFFKHGVYFILHILARTNQTILNKSELGLSRDDEIELSRKTLELAEAIWQVAESTIPESRGFLAVFRNTTDAVPLAQAVMRESARQQSANA